MELNSNIDNLLMWLGELFRAEVVIENNTAIYNSVRNNEVITRISIPEIENIYNQLKNFEVEGETILRNPNIYEVLIREAGTFSPFFRHRNGNNYLDIDDQENDIKYRLARPSNEYILFLIYKAGSKGNAKALTRPIPINRILERCEDEGIAGLDLIKFFLPRFMTLQIQSNKKLTAIEFEKFSSAFLFNISYNTDYSLVQQRNFDELLRTGRITRTRRASIDELNAPRRHYIPDLIHHYQLAVGTDNPMLEYISYYHIAEYFFESIFQEDLIEKVRSKITHPDFSYKRNRDIAGLIKKISTSVKIRNENVTFSEQEALQLTMKKFCNLEEIKEKLIEYDDELIKYYNSNQVEFSSGDIVDFDNPDEEIIFKKIAQRIYKTRNAVVHSKESDKKKYIPFRDDKHLVKEVPLLRFISEQIIFESSTIAG